METKGSVKIVVINLNKTHNIMAKFCRECGSPIEAGEHFCPNCGTKIVAATAPQDPAPVDTARQQTSQPHPNPKPYHQSQSQSQQHVYEDAYADEKAQSVDWKQLNPKLTIGKPQITFISKGKLIFAAIILIIIILAALLQSCSSAKETTGKSQSSSKSPTATKISVKNLLNCIIKFLIWSIFYLIF